VSNGIRTGEPRPSPVAHGACIRQVGRNLPLTPGPSPSRGEGRMSRVGGARYLHNARRANSGGGYMTPRKGRLPKCDGQQAVARASLPRSSRAFESARPSVGPAPVFYRRRFESRRSIRPKNPRAEFFLPPPLGRRVFWGAPQKSPLFLARPLRPLFGHAVRSAPGARLQEARQEGFRTVRTMLDSVRHPPALGTSSDFFCLHPKKVPLF
jgi:hypothetical protein